MKCIICGSRDINDYELLKSAIKESGFNITEVISGCAFGADRLGERWARENDVKLSQYPAEWELYGKLAGRIRNMKMLTLILPPENGCVIALWDGESKGTAHMVEITKKANVKLFVKSPE